MIVKIDAVLRDKIKFGEGELLLQSPDTLSLMKNSAKSGEVVAIGGEQSFDSFRVGSNEFGVWTRHEVSVGDRVHFSYKAMAAYLEHKLVPSSPDTGNVFEIDGEMFVSMQYGLIFLNETTGQSLSGYIIGEVLQEELGGLIKSPHKILTRRMRVRYSGSKAFYTRGDGVRVEVGQEVRFFGEHIPFDAEIFNDTLSVINQNQICELL